MQSHTFPMMPCISAAHHFYGEPKSENCRFSDFIEGLGSEISSKFAVGQNYESEF